MSDTYEINLYFCQAQGQDKQWLALETGDDYVCYDGAELRFEKPEKKQGSEVESILINRGNTTLPRHIRSLKKKMESSDYQEFLPPERSRLVYRNVVAIDLDPDSDELNLPKAIFNLLEISGLSSCFPELFSMFFWLEFHPFMPVLIPAPGLAFHSSHFRPVIFAGSLVVVGLPLVVYYNYLHFVHERKFRSIAYDRFFTGLFAVFAVGISIALTDSVRDSLHDDGYVAVCNHNITDAMPNFESEKEFECRLVLVLSILPPSIVVSWLITSILRYFYLRHQGITLQFCSNPIVTNLGVKRFFHAASTSRSIPRSWPQKAVSCFIPTSLVSVIPFFSLLAAKTDNDAYHDLDQNDYFAVFIPALIFLITVLFAVMNYSLTKKRGFNPIDHGFYYRVRAIILPDFTRQGIWLSPDNNYSISLLCLLYSLMTLGEVFLVPEATKYITDSNSTIPDGDLEYILISVGCAYFLPTIIIMGLFIASQLSCFRIAKDDDENVALLNNGASKETCSIYACSKAVLFGYSNASDRKRSSVATVVEDPGPYRRENTFK